MPWSYYACPHHIYHDPLSQSPIQLPASLSLIVQINPYITIRGEWYRIITAAFLHGGPLHLLGNMLTMHWVAPDLERLAGKPCFLSLYFAGALGAGVMHLTMGSAGAVLVGASGR